MSATAETMAIEITDTPGEAEVARVVGGLVAFNNAAVGASNRQALAVLLRDGAGGRNIPTTDGNG